MMVGHASTAGGHNAHILDCSCVPNGILLFVYLNTVHFSAVRLLCSAVISTGQCCPELRTAVLHLMKVTKFLVFFF